jgi:uncharacterized protein involved in exopolysaccharide biosynthesis
MLRHWPWVLACFLLGLGSGITVALIQQPVYRASVLLAPVGSDSTENSGGPLSGLRSVASLIGSGGGSELLNRGVSTLRSRRFCEMFLETKGVRQQLTHDLVTAWSIRKLFNQEQHQPTTEDLCDYFNSRVHQVSIDTHTSYVTLSVVQGDRVLAAEWANDMAAAVNRDLREQTIREATLSLEYLKKELAGADTVELRQAISRAMESKVATRSLAATRPDYAFSVVDPATVRDPGKYDSPHRVLIALGGGLVGLFVGCLCSYFLRSRGRP